MTKQDVHEAIIDYIADTGAAPTLRHIQERIGGSLSQIHKRVEVLRAEGVLVRGRRNLSGQLWPTELVDAIRDNARYMAGQMKRR